MYIRFAVSERDDRSDQDQGVFTALYRLDDEGHLSAEELTWFRSTASWFNKHLSAPDDHKGIVVSEHRTEKPGYIVYEDEFQVAAMPFQSETF